MSDTYAEVDYDFLDSIDSHAPIHVLSDDSRDSAAVVSYLVANGVQFSERHSDGLVEDRPQLIVREGEKSQRYIGKRAIAPSITRIIQHR